MPATPQAPAPNVAMPPAPVVVTGPPPAPAAADNASPVDAPSEEPPITLLVRRIGGTADVLLRSHADTAMQVSVRDMNPQLGQTSQVQVSLEPREARSVGAQDGLEMHSRDRIVIHVDGYQDRESLNIP
jgi:hypothetical protein